MTALARRQIDEFLDQHNSGMAIAVCLDTMPLRDVERLAQLFSPSALRRRRLAERDRLIVELAPHFPAGSARDMARRIRAWLKRVAATANDATDPRHDLAHRVLALHGGLVPSTTTIRNALFGIGGRKSGAVSGHRS